MILISIKDFPVINGISHVKTNYEIYTDPNGVTLVDSNYGESIAITRYKSNLIPIIGVDYYVRTQRILSDGTVSRWTPLAKVALVYDQESLLLNKKITLIQPIMSVDTGAIVDPSILDFTITLSPFASIGENHYSTDWVIIGENGDAIYSSIGDQNNLESITINKKSILLNKNNKIKICAKYNTASGASTTMVKTTMDLGTKNYKITSTLTNINSTIDYTLTFQPINESLHVNVAYVSILDNANNTIYYSVLDIDTITHIIPAGTLSPTKTYTMIIYYLEDNILHQDTEQITTA